MLKNINKQQIELLKKNDYFVFPELFVIKDKSNEQALFNIYFHPNAGVFGLQVFPAVIQDNKAMFKYSQELDKRFRLIQLLNTMGGTNE